jgi:hypothetical protein
MLGQTKTSIPLLVQDDEGTPLQATAVIAVIERPGGWDMKWSDWTNSLGDATLTITPDLAELPMHFIVLPPASHQLEPSFADATRNPDGVVVVTARRSGTPAEMAIKTVGIFLAGAGVGVLGYLGMRWFLKKESPL